MNSVNKFRRRFRPYLKKIIASLVLVVLGAGLIVVNRSLFIISQITCTTFSGQSCPEELVNRLKNERGKSLLFFNQKSLKTLIQKDLSGQNPTISFKLPGKLIIKVETPELIPAAAYLFYGSPSLSYQNSNSDFALPIKELNQLVSTLSAQPSLLSANGDLIFAKKKDNHKLNLIFSQKIKADKLQVIYQLIIKTASIYSIRQIFVVDNDLYFDLSGLPNIILALDTPEGKSKKLLESIPTLAKIKMNAKIIDLRFNNPIIR